MNLSKELALGKKEIISIVGAGGKTTMLFKFAKELAKEHRVLVTTTTKIFAPDKEQYDFLCTDKNEFEKYENENKNGIYVFGLGINKDNKIIGLSESEIEILEPYFDYIIIEADGSKQKPLKGWNETEPIIYSKTTKNIGILDIRSIGTKINEENIHRSELFCKIAKAKINENVSLENIENIIIDPNGLFKNSKGEKILYINKVENSQTILLAKQLVRKIKQNHPDFLNEIIIGSLKYEIYV